MKFAEHLATRLTPEWRKQYIQYEQMKTMLYDMFSDFTPTAEVDDDIRRRQVALKEEAFFKFCADELNKINLFFNQKMAEAQTKMRDLNREIDVLQKIAQTKLKKSAKPTQIINRIGGGIEKKQKSDEKSTLVAGGGPSSSQFEEKVQPKTLRELKTAYAEFYLSLVLLQNYQQLNCTGFRKILKKHDKLLATDRGSEWYKQNIEHAAFVDNKEIDSLITNTEKAVTDNLEGGNRQAAMKRLRVPPLSEAQNAWTTFRLGFFLGSFLVLSFLIFLTVLVQSRPREPRWVGVRLFRGFFILFANLFFMGINMYGWQSSGVNHVLIFEIDPRDHLTYQSLMEVSSFFLMIWALGVLGYLHADALYVPSTIFPLILILFSLLWLFNPLPVMRKSARYWFIKHVFYCFSAPFHKVVFPDFWLADQMNSLVTFFLDMEYFVCFYAYYVDYAHSMSIIVKNTFLDFSSNSTTTSFDELLSVNHSETVMAYHTYTYGIDAVTGADQCMSNVYGIRPIISCLPALIRFLQCIRRYRDSKHKHPHLTNAGKYATTFFVVIFGSLNTYFKRVHGDNGFFYVWVLAYVVSFVYTYVWDIKMDWGLLDKTATNDKILRDDLIYSRKEYYYAAMVEDFLLRLAWVLNVSLGDAWSAEADLLMLVTAPLECLRRFIWNYFRLENEHVNNCGQFRAIRDIHIAPISRRTDWDDMEHKVDDDDGVTHRGSQFQTLLDKKLKNKSRKNVFKRKIVQTFKSAGSSTLSSLTAGGDQQRRPLFPRHASMFVPTFRSSVHKLDTTPSSASGVSTPHKVKSDRTFLSHDTPVPAKQLKTELLKNKKAIFSITEKADDPAESSAVVEPKKPTEEQQQQHEIRKSSFKRSDSNRSSV